MPRRQRLWLDRACYHITHRCHKRDFLLKFAKDRGAYTKLLRETVKRYRISVLNYIVTSNHIHLLVWARDSHRMSEAVQFLHGSMGQMYNHRKGRQGAFWTDRHNQTLVQDGRHLGCCLFYIDFNMVRATSITHPKEWRDCGYHELIGSRRRYRIIDVERLIKCLDMPSLEVFRDWYANNIEERVERTYHCREAFWSSSVAVGERDWVRDLATRCELNPDAVVEHARSHYLPADDRSRNMRLREGASAPLACSYLICPDPI